jgi:hypothetical protein
VVCLPILAPPAGSLHAKAPFKISLSSVSFGSQQSLVKNQVRGGHRRLHHPLCHHRAGVAWHDVIPLQVLLTGFSGDRHTIFQVSRLGIRYVWCISIYDPCGLCVLNCGLVWSGRREVYDVNFLFSTCAILHTDNFQHFCVLELNATDCVHSAIRDDVVPVD